MIKYDDNIIDAWYFDVTDDWAIYELFIRNPIEP